MTNIDALRAKYYPDKSQDGTVRFYEWIRQSIQKAGIVLNVGAGPGSEKQIRSLKGEVSQVIGIDIDDAVLGNPDIDKGIVVSNNAYPFPDNHFDMVWADYVLEHVGQPDSFMREIRRVLKPGSPFFFRTPNRSHYVSLISRCTPHWFHDLVANRARGLAPGAHEPYPVFYRLNSKRQILRCASSAGFSEIDLRFVEAEPSYLAFHPIAFYMGVMYERLVNRFHCLNSFRSNIFGRMVKRH